MTKAEELLAQVCEENDKLRKDNERLEAEADAHYQQYLREAQLRTEAWREAHVQDRIRVYTVRAHAAERAVEALRDVVEVGRRQTDSPHYTVLGAEFRLAEKALAEYDREKASVSGKPEKPVRNLSAPTEF